MNLACFTSFQPNPITIDSIAVSESAGVVAVGLSNGSIRIHDLATMAVRAAIPGNSTRSVRRILFHENRLLTSGIHGTVTMWDMQACTEIVSLDSSQGAIWDMVVRENTLYLATETGSVVLVDIEDSDLRISTYWRSSSKDKSIRATALCIESDFLFVGDSAGTISRWNIAKADCDSTFALPTKNSIAPLIWNMVALGNGTFATGDSTGTLSIWDASSSTLIRSRQDHQADILIMARSSSSSELFTSGVDSRLVRYRIEPDQTLNMIAVGTVISRDVSALACIESPKRGVIVGGADGRLGLVQIHPSATSIPSATRLSRFYPCDIRLVAPGQSDRLFCQEHCSTISIFAAKNTSVKPLGEIENKESISTFAVDPEGSRILVASVSGTCRILTIDENRISQQSKFQMKQSGGIVTAAAVNNKITLIGTSTGSVSMVDLRNSEDPIPLLPTDSGIKQLLINESSSKATIVSIDGEVYTTTLVARKRKDDVVKKFKTGSIVTAVCSHLIKEKDEEGSIVLLVTADHRVIAINTTNGTELWSYQIPKSFKGFSKQTHINWIEFDANVITLFSESCMLTLQIPGAFAEGPMENELKLHSLSPLGGIAIGAGKLPVPEEPSPKKQRKSIIGGAKAAAQTQAQPILLALNSYKAIHNKLVDQFERKSFQA